MTRPQKDGFEFYFALDTHCKVRDYAIRNDTGEGFEQFIGRSETADLLPPFYTVYPIRRHGGNMQVRNVVVLVPMRLHAPS